ncbi:hypothetical protein SODALDRAFT_296578 [Sodiomyces alkalinus F11]|uniref:Uncharacterized protein n=1 Tax=Sodiomyces alkalinus (strain CBS 110278 / VKM F-3762 / F11) TaxID=1314773 RepID=A0A3N2PUB5_SODAK|nr:hypothetical protein SODALDRAFT_296578 [Sodiomyces alkalinus F11]ROT38072.1 hypothetical protein SODALDRAFT_296578 [Sodiomyces alkalinus F11]
MAPTFRIHKPDVLATLPRPLGQSKGRYHAGEVYVQQPGSKKRKRLEVAVGVDGEAANIYHIPSSDLRTSYPIPPQESFTCAPYSIRYQQPANSERQQYTYLSTSDSSGFKMTLCKDVVNSAGKTTSTTKSRRLSHKAPVARLFTSSCAVASAAAGSVTQSSDCSDVLAVCQDGQVLCLDGAGLDEQWSVSSYSLCKDLLPPSTSGFTVDSVFHASAVEVLKGIFEGRQDAFGSFGQPVDAETFNPDVLVLVVGSQSHVQGPSDRYLVLLGAVPQSATARSSQQALVQLHVAPLPRHDGLSGKQAPTYHLQVRSGKLFELSDGTIRTYRLTGALPRIQDVVLVSEASSFVPLSEHCVLSLSPSMLTVANVTYHSIQARAPVTLDGGRGGAEFMLLTYLTKLDLAIAIVNNTLLSIQVERHGSSHKEGLLIDAIGKGLSKADDLPESLPPLRGKGPFKSFIPGTLTDSYVKQSLVEVEKLDEYLAQNDLKEFERLLASKLGVAIEESSAEAVAVNGVAGRNDEDLATPDWKWLERANSYPAVDRRWVLYAISRVFSIHVGDSSSTGAAATAAAADGPSLECSLPESNVLLYLIVAGHLTLSNITAAFKHELSETHVPKEALADELVRQLIEIDPALELLLSYVSATKLGEAGLLLIVRTIMQSLDHQPRLAPAVPNGTNGTNGTSGTKEEEDYVAMEIDQLEHELELAEYNLGDNSDVRARLLTMAFERLVGYSPAATVRALRASFGTAEILSLIHLLRIQLVGSAWTTRYSELTSLDQDDGAKAPPDGAIALIAELLARCVDAVGPNGWLSSGSGSGSGSSSSAAGAGAGDHWDGGHFLAALKLEVSAALEGLNDAVHLNGILGEAVRFGTLSLASGGGAAGRGVAVAAAAARGGQDRPKTLEVGTSAQLPLGLTPKQAVTQFKVVSGGEVVERSAREKGHLLSQRVKEYSLEKVAV